MATILWVILGGVIGFSIGRWGLLKTVHKLLGYVVDEGSTINKGRDK